MFLVLESVQVFPSLFANARSVEQLSRSETATSKTNILVFFLTNKKLFAGIIYIKIIIVLKVHVYGQKKLKKLIFQRLPRNYIGFCWIFPDRSSSKELWKQNCLGSRTPLRNRNKISDVWCKIEHTLLLRNHHHYHHLRRPLH